MKRILIFIAILVLIGVSAIAIHQSKDAQKAKIDVQNIQVELDKNGQKIDQLETEKTQSEEEVQKHQEEIKKLQEEKQDLEKKLQAKLQKQKEAEVLAQKRGPVASAAESAPTPVSGDKHEWLRAAGIPESDWWAVDYVISHESGWRYTVWNTSGSGAYGLCQSLPASKMASAGSDYMTNPVTQLKWCHSYAIGRYKSWSGAYNVWVAQQWW